MPGSRDKKLDELQKRLRCRFKDARILANALRHASASEGELSNERLEFLGDAVVGLVVSDWAYRQTPAMSEGDMTLIKSAVVSRRTLAKLGGSLALGDFLEVDQGLKRRKRIPVSLLANAYEAVVGAVFVDADFGPAAKFILRTLGPELKQALAGRQALNHKAMLQQCAQAEGKGSPRYSVVRFEGPEHERRYLTVVHICGEECGGGWGPTKKAAEQNAARSALDKCYPGWAKRKNASAGKARRGGPVKDARPG
jgi:ribonuclease-3